MFQRRFNLRNEIWQLVETKGSYSQVKRSNTPGLVTVLGKPGDELAPG